MAEKEKLITEFRELQKKASDANEQLARAESAQEVC